MKILIPWNHMELKLMKQDDEVDVLNVALFGMTAKEWREKNPNLENKQSVAEAVGTGAVIFGALINSRIKDIVFSYDKVLNFEGETAPYVQYTYARCVSLLQKADNKIGDYK